MDFDVAYDKLASLQTVWDVADFLIDQGCKGIPCRAFKCPISQYFKMNNHVVAASDKIRHYDWNKAEMVEDRPLTDSMQQFIHDFDHGKIPELIEPELYI